MKLSRFGKIVAAALPLSKTVTMSMALFGASSVTANASAADDAWLAAVEQNTTASYSKFILDFPNSQYASEAECRVGMFDAGTTGSASPEGGGGASGDADFCLNLPAAQSLLNV